VCISYFLSTSRPLGCAFVHRGPLFFFGMPQSSCFMHVASKAHLSRLHTPALPEGMAPCLVCLRPMAIITEANGITGGPT
jgi:hypothetical protein